MGWEVAPGAFAQVGSLTPPSLRFSLTPFSAPPESVVPTPATWVPVGSARARRNVRPKRPWIAAALLVNAGLGAALLWSSLPPKPHDDFVAIYFTDVPGDFENVVVGLRAVYVGEAQASLELKADAIDLAAHRGPQNSILVASGLLPKGDYGQISVEFKSAAGYRNGQWERIQVSDDLLTLEHDLANPASGRGAFLLDFDLEASLVPGLDGFQFVPNVAKIYFDDLADDVAGQAPEKVESLPTPTFAETSAKTPLLQVRGKATAIPPAETAATSASSSETSSSSSGNVAGAEIALSAEADLRQTQNPSVSPAISNSPPPGSSSSAPSSSSGASSSSSTPASSSAAGPTTSGSGLPLPTSSVPLATSSSPASSSSAAPSSSSTCVLQICL